MPGAQSGYDIDKQFGRCNYVYVPATRQSPVLLIAHADVFEETTRQPNLAENDKTISNPGDCLGADDRAGCAIIWALRHLGHGILITDHEERGCIGAKNIRRCHPELMDELQKRHQFMMEFDRKNRSDFKCYDVATENFRNYVGAITDFYEPDRNSHTDITVLARDICGVNLSCGYRLPHTDQEYIVKDDWLNTLHIAEKWLSASDLPRFERTAKA